MPCSTKLSVISASQVLQIVLAGGGSATGDAGKVGCGVGSVIGSDIGSGVGCGACGAGCGVSVGCSTGSGADCVVFADV